MFEKTQSLLSFDRIFFKNFVEREKNKINEQRDTGFNDNEANYRRSGMHSNRCYACAHSECAQTFIIFGKPMISIHYATTDAALRFPRTQIHPPIEFILFSIFRDAVTFIRRLKAKLDATRVPHTTCNFRFQITD